MDGRPIANSVAWYEAVLRAHGIRGRVDEHYWSTDESTPPYYSNLITLTDGVEAQHARVEQLAPAHPWSVKDSFALLDLEPFGLRVLFEARWCELDAVDGSADVRFEAVTTPAQLARWERAWQVTSPAPGRRIFPPALLMDDSVTFLAALRDDVFVGGAIANLSPGAVGISNVFGCSEIDAAAELRRRHPDRAVVGYGREVPSGFRDLGPLRVWVTRPPARRKPVALDAAATLPDGWERAGNELTRTFTFPSFEDAMRFMDEASEHIARVDHHPRWENSHRKVTVWLSTWSIGRKPSSFDVELAEYLNRLQSRR